MNNYNATEHNGNTHSPSFEGSTYGELVTRIAKFYHANRESASVDFQAVSTVDENDVEHFFDLAAKELFEARVNGEIQQLYLAEAA